MVISIQYINTGKKLGNALFYDTVYEQACKYSYVASVCMDLLFLHANYNYVC